ncbi:Ectonucleoside triphosphate diphosphohydrolase 6 [Camelus dromedarius]|uniref:Ectonucleoside triphosphate diphosphohydrolase 6 n=1 Tax=Camelus dromedarius TaxID=9838 RepID=A0A5N4CTZ4_CAMDR|nr:Ectonucleoside triphosphate diphosphohydrolase 6 [Camelus dromedarius]
MSPARPHPQQTEMRKIPNNGNLRVPRVAYPLGLLACLFIYIAYIKWHWASATQAFLSITEAAAGARRGQQAHSPSGAAAHAHEVFYGIMFDAGSTGTRVHIFQFTRPHGGIQELLGVAKQDIPSGLWQATPLVLRATAGLRLLPGEKAQKLLQKVKEVFEASPFLLGTDCVSIMNGTDEGVSAWITVNFLTGGLRAPGRGSVGTLDLGGGSTQITFLPRVEGTLQTSPPGYLTSLQMFNRTYKLYSYSYLGLGLMSARLAVLGGKEGKPAGNLYQLCAARVSEILRDKVHKTEEAKDVDFYAFSYYYDLAANVGLIDAEKGGSLVVADFEIAAKYVCRTAEAQPPHNPFLCLDLTYVSLLLREFGFPGDKELKLTQKIDNVETSWALGATFHYIDSLSRRKSPTS